MARSFVAIDLPETMKRSLETIAEDLRRRVPRDSVRWTRISGIHLTLKFLGDVAQVDIPGIQATLAEAGQRHGPFTCIVGDLGCFPGARKPRVVWVGVRETTGSLRALQRDIDESLVSWGFQPEKRGFHPHLTLGRIKRHVRPGDQRRVGEVIATTEVGELGKIQVDSFRLMRSDLRRDGAVYTPLSVVSLNPRQNE
jgi:2'-5' RNA ligase